MKNKFFFFFLRLFGRNEISFFPFWEDLKTYRWKAFQRDLFAAISVALLTIPQSMAYSLLAGLPPSSGFFSAIFGAIFVGAFGSSRYLIAGPSTGVSLLLQTVVSNTLYTYFPTQDPIERASLSLHILTNLVMMIGLLQFLGGFFNLGKLLQFVSRSVILGYFAGVGIALAVNQFFYFLGIPAPIGYESLLKKLNYLFSHFLEVRWQVLFIGVPSLFFLLFLRRRYPRFPGALAILIGASLFVFFLKQWFSFSIPSLGDIGGKEFLKMHFSLPSLDFGLLKKLFPSACAIALLAILEVFSISREFAAKGGQYVRSNQEMFGLGLSNLFLAFIPSAMPTSGSLSRSSLNFQNKAKSRFASVFSGLFALLVFFFFWPFVRHVPLTALSALLLAALPTFIDREQIKISFRATKEDFLVFMLTMSSCLVFSLEVAFFVGILIAIATFLRKASIPHLVEYAFTSSGRLVVIDPHKQVKRKIRIIGVGGELFFAAVDLFQNALQTVAKDPYVKVIILRLQGAFHMDASMCVAILRINEYLKATDRHLVISGISEEVWEVFFRAGVVHVIDESNLFHANETHPQLSTWRACQRAQDLTDEWP